jgi:uncharacterized CHY-type Zn-finger protein
MLSVLRQARDIGGRRCAYKNAPGRIARQQSPMLKTEAVHSGNEAAMSEAFFAARAEIRKRGFNCGTCHLALLLNSHRNFKLCPHCRSMTPEA